jgi:hypothetical protein
VRASTEDAYRPRPEHLDEAGTERLRNFGHRSGSTVRSRCVRSGGRPAGIGYRIFLTDQAGNTSRVRLTTGPCGTRLDVTAVVAELNDARPASYRVDVESW